MSVRWNREKFIILRGSKKTPCMQENKRREFYLNKDSIFPYFDSTFIRWLNNSAI